MSVEQLTATVEALQSRLDLTKSVAEKRSSGEASVDVSDPAAAEGAKKAAPKMVAAKAEGTWAELPWGVAGKQDAQKIHDYITKNMSEVSVKKN